MNTNSDITLVIPRSGFLLDERVFPALGVLKVAAVLEASGHKVDVLDLSGVDDDSTHITRHIEGSPCKLFGITATTPQLPAAIRNAETIRAARPGARLILGGPHATLVHASARQEVQRGSHGRGRDEMDRLRRAFDTIVCGDGERAIFAALEDDAPPVIDSDDPSSPLFLTNADVERLPMPARHLIDLDSYKYSIGGVRAHSLIAQLGCPFGCRFCGGRRSHMLRRVRTRSAQQVVNEMLEIHQAYGTSGFMFFDDELNVNTALDDLLERVIAAQMALGCQWTLRGFLKAELVTGAVAKKMYDAGFRQVLIGVESGSPRVLTNIDKKATRSDNARAVSTLQGIGIMVKAAMSLGHPGESPTTVEETREWLLSAAPSDFDVSIITVYPGTPYYDDAVLTAPGRWTYTCPGTGDRLHAYDVSYSTEEAFYKGIPGRYKSFVYTDELSASDICNARDTIEREVRAALDIPWPRSAAALNYDHSMGQL